MSDDLTIAYMLGVEDMRSKLHKQADEIERLRAENETLRRDVKTAVMGDSAELQDVKRENEKLHREAAIRIDQIEREQEAHLRTIADYNRAAVDYNSVAVENEKLRGALKLVCQSVISERESIGCAVIEGAALRAAAKALGESDE